MKIEWGIGKTGKWHIFLEGKQRPMCVSFRRDQVQEFRAEPDWEKTCIACTRGRLKRERQRWWKRRKAHGDDVGVLREPNAP